jgi:hypothetical protein
VQTLNNKNFFVLMKIVGDEDSLRVEEIRLKGCSRVSAVVLDFIAEKMKKLKRIHVKQTKFKREEIANFSKKMITCEIHSDFGIIYFRNLKKNVFKQKNRSGVLDKKLFSKSDFFVLNKINKKNVSTFSLDSKSFGVSEKTLSTRR